jgi:hypothetical protein
MFYHNFEPIDILMYFLFIQQDDPILGVVYVAEGITSLLSFPTNITCVS